MRAFEVIPGRSYRGWDNNIYRVREIHAGRAYFHIDGIHLIPLASSPLEDFASRMAKEVHHRKGQRG